MRESEILYSQSMLNPKDKQEVEKTVKFWEEATNLEVQPSLDREGRVIIKFTKNHDKA